MRLRWRALRDQLGYKLPILLSTRARDQASFTDQLVNEILVGDDAEADAFVYSLYADVVSGKVDARLLRRILDTGHVYDGLLDVEIVEVALDKMPPCPTKIMMNVGNPELAFEFAP